MSRFLARKRARARGELSGIHFKIRKRKRRKALRTKSAESADLNGAKKNDKMSYFNLKKSADSAGFKFVNVEEFDGREFTLHKKSRGMLSPASSATYRRLLDSRWSTHAQ